MTEYYKLPEKTAETKDADGWVHTGDIGIFLADGNLKIVDRKKNIFKLSQGEYVAPEKVENVVVQSPFAAQVFVYGDSMKSRLVAVIFPTDEVIFNWAKNYGKDEDFTALCQDEDLKKVILADITKTCKEAKFHSFEIPKAIALVNPTKGTFSATSFDYIYCPYMDNSCKCKEWSRSSLWQYVGYF